MLILFSPRNYSGFGINAFKNGILYLNSNLFRWIYFILRLFMQVGDSPVSKLKISSAAKKF